MGLAVGEWTAVRRRTAGVACATIDLGQLVKASVEAPSKRAGPFLASQRRNPSRPSAGAFFC